MSRIVISQSFIKAMNHGRDIEELTDLDHPQCPAKAKAVHLDGMPTKETESMRKGNYLETLLWGSTETGEVVTLPLLKSGKKSVDQLRIERSAFLLKERWSAEYRMDWRTIRHHITIGLNERYVFRARLDAISSMYDPGMGEETMETVIVDLKLTGGLNNTFGPFAWGAPHTMDHTQAYLYSWAYEQVHGVRVPFYYIVLSYKDIDAHKRIRVNVDNMRIREALESMRRTMAAIDRYTALENWPRIPSNMNCASCPLKNVCPSFRSGGQTLVV